MKLKTNKGALDGTVTYIAAWLEMNQPSVASIEVELNHITSTVDIETPEGQESGWENTLDLRKSIRAAWVQASIECGGQPAV